MRTDRVVVKPDVIEEFRKIDPACIGDVLGGVGLRGIVHGLFPLDRAMKLCGPAVTIRQIASRDIGRVNWARHEQVLVEMCRPGDVFVIDAGGRMDGGSWGGNVSIEAKNRGLEGTVADGVVRDTEEILRLGYPTYCRGVDLAHSHGLFASTCLNSEPVQIGVGAHAVMVAPGDLVIGDADGLVVVPAERAAELLDLSKRRHEADLELGSLIASGKIHGDPEVDAQIAKAREFQSVEQPEGYKW